MAETESLEARPADFPQEDKELPHESLAKLMANCTQAAAVVVHIFPLKVPFMRRVALVVAALVRGEHRLTALRRLALVEQIPAAAVAAVSASAEWRILSEVPAVLESYVYVRRSS